MSGQSPCSHQLCLATLISAHLSSGQAQHARFNLSLEQSTWPQLLIFWDMWRHMVFEHGPAA